jgi:hypothetical protein
MRLIARGFTTFSVLTLFIALAFAAVAQELVIQRLTITKATSVRQVESGIVEVVVALQDGSKAALRMNVYTARNLANQLNRFGM